MYIQKVEIKTIYAKVVELTQQCTALVIIQHLLHHLKCSMFGLPFCGIVYTMVIYKQTFDKRQIGENI